MSETTKNKKTAIVLFNLGGPDSLASVKPFLFNLFNDKKIITLPAILRYFIAWIISCRREGTAKEIYASIGGKSPILHETKRQADSLKQSLGAGFEVFICMRHWHPMASQVVAQLESYSPNEIILLPLYPQFSITTSASSIEDFTTKLSQSSLKSVVCKGICCYPKEENFVKAHVELVSEAIKKITNKDNFRILFSAHGLPKKIIDSGDPYQWQIETTVNAVINLLNIQDPDYKITYQSRVGPLQWIEPNTEDEIRSAAEQSKDLIIVPIAFVSEHVETLVELDIEYKKIADEYSVNYIRVPTLSINTLFIKSLMDIIKRVSKKNGRFLCSGDMSKICPENYSKCPYKGVS